MPSPCRSATIADARDVVGCAPGRVTTTRQLALPGSAPDRSCGSRPARTRDDLPTPDWPMTARNRLWPQILDQPLHLGPAPEEEPGVLLLERLQAAVRALAAAPALRRLR